MRTFFVAILTLFVTSAVFCQTYNSGDKELDANLKSINLEANKNLSQFKLDITKTYATSEAKVNTMFSIGMTAGDVYIAFEIATITRKPIDDVITVYKRSKSKGWGAMAKELGIKPGSAEFHKLKGNCKNKSDKKAKTSNGNSSGKGNKGNGKGNGNGKKGK